MAKKWNKEALISTAAERMRNQALTNSQIQSPEDLLAWMGPMQSQDLTMSLWAIGCRITGISETDMLESLRKGSILR
ncbi:MAG: hypothetical protein KDK33_15475, partial [Leptospiraceae bacterium]|nr:hypothetical protein [Leptospiraceae bacterium]